MGKGLIIPAATIVKDASDTSSSIGGGIDPALIRNWVIFWDEFICPDNNFISVGLPPDLEYLQSIGKLKRNKISFSGGIASGNFSRLFLAAQEITYYQKNSEEPGKWTMAQSEEILHEHKTTETEPCLVFDLVNSIQIPDRLVSIEDIMNFKHSRSDELREFHSYMEELYIKIVNSKDIPRTKTHELEKLERAIAQYNRVLCEGFSKRLLTSLRIVLDRSLIESTGMGLAAAGFASPIGLPALGIGTMAACATFALRNVLTINKEKTSQHPLTYITRVENELF